ncbi:serine/threonine protein kinase [Streptomyces sp. SB3404]|uniref:non-specific serine/threonine protein kinase n=2 Tax=Streptomyces boncukensis TaxID=2711219 RepID=A0A6G4XAL1_9ACTN|nr:serine/threonine protein kinase [Streptomyces boncukensis]
MGTVWRARDEVVERDVAVKEPRVPDQLTEAERQTVHQRMLREARTAARIDHPSVVTIHDVVMEDGRPWIVMELVQGRSLGSVLEEGTLDAREAARIGHAVAGALDAAHATGVLHRDVKPDNVLLGRYERVVLTDFGIAQVEGERRLTETGAFVGSPEYTAPERVLGQRPGPESDLWSLGVVLYAATEGVSPFRRSNTPATLQAVLSAEVPRPAQAERGSGALGMLIARLLGKEPTLRPDAAEVRQTLADVARPPQPGTPTAAAATAVAGGGVGRVLRQFGGRLRTSRAWQFGTLAVAVAVAAAVAVPLLLPGDDVPDGWKAYDEDKRVRASLAAPGSYDRSADQDQVAFTDPGGVIEMRLSRSAKDVKNTSLLEANNWKQFYEDGAQESYRDTMDDVRSTVSEADHQGQDAASVVTTYKPAEDSNRYEKDAGTKRKRRHELIYVNKDNVRWRLVVEMPGKGSSRDEGEKVYREAVKSLKINDL